MEEDVHLKYAWLLCGLLVACASVDLGGSIDAYVRAGEHIRDGTIMWRIPDKCFSACTMEADVARPNACLGPNTKLLFHAVTLPNGTPSTDPRMYYSPDIAMVVHMSVIKKYHLRGGYVYDLNQAWEMPRDVALKYWPICGRGETG